MEGPAEAVEKRNYSFWEAANFARFFGQPSFIRGYEKTGDDVQEESSEEQIE